MTDIAEARSHDIPTILVIFGITGDLAKKKLIPALFSLHHEKMLPAHFRVVGFSRRDLSRDQFCQYVQDIITSQGAYAHDSLGSFLEFFSFARGRFEEEGDYEELRNLLIGIDQEWGLCANKLFYCAVNPEFYKVIFKNLAAHCLTDSCGPDGSSAMFANLGKHGAGWTRVIVEKPFGHDLRTAHELDELLGRLFTEDQLYRIDHYLAKEMLQNILLFRFANNLFEKSWSNETIEQISIRLWEKIGAEDRGSFYDGVGALRDVGQNHLLQMLALVTMERPENFRAYAIRSQRAEILKRLIIPSRKDIIRTSFRAQYKGYNDIPGVKPDSHTETYFKIYAQLSHVRWRGVPMIMEGGKRLGAQEKEIEVVFKHPVPCFCPPGATEHYQNRVVFSLEPDEKITIHFWSKKPGFVTEMEERTFEFLLRGTSAGGSEKKQYVEEYQKLLLDCIAGDQTLFVSTEEIRSMWQFVDPIVRAWKANAVPLAQYAPDTNEWCRDILNTDPLFNSTKNKNTAFVLAEKKIGLVGLGKMGKNLVLHLLEQGWQVVVFDVHAEVVKQLAHHGAEPAESIEELVRKLPKLAIVWLMLPAGKPTEETLFNKNGLTKILKKGDIIIDGGNSFYRDSIAREKKLNRAGIHFLDAGISGGPAGARHGACIMVGGDKKIFGYCESLIRDLSVIGGYEYVGKSGAGHFVKMAHNGIEYGMMQALAEGFSVMKKSTFALDLPAIAELFNHGSVIESHLVGWLKSAYDEYGILLKNVSGSVDSTGEGKWTVEAAHRLKIPVPVIEQAFKFRLVSQKKPSYTGKILSALRNQFGGHKVEK